MDPTLTGAIGTLGAITAGILWVTYEHRPEHIEHKLEQSAAHVNRAAEAIKRGDLANAQDAVNRSVTAENHAVHISTTPTSKKRSQRARTQTRKLLEQIKQSEERITQSIQAVADAINTVAAKTPPGTPHAQTITQAAHLAQEAVTDARAGNVQQAQTKTTAAKNTLNTLTFDLRTMPLVGNINAAADNANTTIHAETTTLGETARETIEQIKLKIPPEEEKPPAASIQTTLTTQQQTLVKRAATYLTDCLGQLEPTLTSDAYNTSLPGAIQTLEKISGEPFEKITTALKETRNLLYTAHMKRQNTPQECIKTITQTLTQLDTLITAKTVPPILPQITPPPIQIPLTAEQIAQETLPKIDQVLKQLDTNPRAAARTLFDLIKKIPEEP